MITDLQVRKLLKYLSQGKSLEAASASSGMDEKTGRKYRNLKRLPSEIKAERSRSWRTRNDPLGELWGTARSFLENNRNLEVKKLFTYLQRENPGRISGSQLRTFQRRVKSWRATEGAGHEVFFPGRHEPGKMSRASFRNLSTLQVRLAGQPFDHLVYHFVLTFSNWETGTIMLSDDFKSLGEGLQRSLCELGGVPHRHRTDNIAEVADKAKDPLQFIIGYQNLLAHYRLVEQFPPRTLAQEKCTADHRYCHFEKALDQALILRGSRNFTGFAEYEDFVRRIFQQLNQHRWARLQNERASLHPLPLRKWDERALASSGATAEWLG